MVDNIAKDEDDLSEKSLVISNIILPSSAQDRQEIKNALAEIGNSLTRIDSERDHINAVLDAVKENQEIPKKYMRRLAMLIHKQRVAEAQVESEDIDLLYETIFDNSNS